MAMYFYQAMINSCCVTEFSWDTLHTHTHVHAQLSCTRNAHVHSQIHNSAHPRKRTQDISKWWSHQYPFWWNNCSPTDQSSSAVIVYPFLYCWERNGLQESPTISPPKHGTFYLPPESQELLLLFWREYFSFGENVIQQWVCVCVCARLCIGWGWRHF